MLGKDAGVTALVATQKFEGVRLLVMRGARAKLMLLPLLCIALTACGSASGGLQKMSGGLQSMSDGALEAVGLKAPEPTAAELAAPKSLTFRVVAGQNLNADARGRGIPLVVRVYTLRDAATFSRLTYDQFLDSQREKAALGEDLVAVKEVILAPGKQVTQTESIPAHAKYFAVVGQFMNPAPERWRYIFAVDANSQNGILIGAHACALTVSQGTVTATAITDPGSLNAVRCKAEL